MENQPIQNNTEITHEVTIYAEPLTQVHGFSVTNSLLTSWVVVFIIVLISIALRKNLKKVPGRFQNLFEIVIDGALGIADQVTGDRKVTEKVFPLAICVFFFVPFLRSGTADINTTLALALIAVIGSNIFGIMAIGVWKIFNKYVNLKALGSIPGKIRRDPTILLVAPITFFVGILELIGEFAKIASLSFRLFGNVFAGEVLLLSMGAILAYGLPVPFLFLEVFVGVIQALIFSMLVLVYFTIAAQDHDAHDENHEHAHA